MAEIKIKNGMMKRHDSSKNTDPSRRSQQLSQNRIAVMQPEDVDIDTIPTASHIVIADVPVDLIQDRSDNRFRITGIEKLASEIEKHGLHQNIIIVKKRDEEGYIASSGHRRLHAYRLLKDRFAQEHPGEENPYNKIPAEIKSNLSDDEENDIYLKTNSFSRNTTLMEAIANTKPEEMDFEDSSFKEEYLKYMYGENALERYVNGEIEDKMNFNSLSEYVFRKITETFQDLECSEESVRKYLRIYMKASDIVLDKFFKDEMSIKQMLDIVTTFSKEEQMIIFNAEDPDEKRREILNRRKKPGKKKVENNPTCKKLNREITKYTKPILMLCDELDKIDPSEAESKEYKRILDLKDAILKYVAK